MLSLLAILLMGAPLDTPHPKFQPAMYLDSALIDFSKTFMSPNNVQSIQVDNKQADSLRHTQGAVYIQLKPGTNVFLTLDQVCKKQSIDIQGSPVIYFVDGKPLVDTGGVRIQEDYISKVTLTQTKDIPSAGVPKTAQSIALVIIETTTPRPKPKPGEKTIILRGSGTR